MSPKAEMLASERIESSILFMRGCVAEPVLRRKDHYEVEEVSCIRFTFEGGSR
jgi:hypothetical protein